MDLSFVSARLTRRLHASQRLAEARRLAPEALSTISPAQGFPPPDQWVVLWQKYTLTKTALLALGPPQGPPAALMKVVPSPLGAAALERERVVVATLAAETRLGSWRRLLPVQIGCGRIGDRAYVLESVLPGSPATPLLRHKQARAALQAAAAGVIGELHAKTTLEAEVDEATICRWVTEPLQGLLAAGVQKQAVLRIEDELYSSLTGRRLRVGWIHGDFWPGNLLVKNGEITGIVDWEAAQEGHPPLHDTLQWLLSCLTLTGAGDVGKLLSGWLSGRLPMEYRLLLEEALEPSGGPDPREALLLFWVRHVGYRLLDSPEYARHLIWMRKMVHPVLETV